MPEVQAQAGRVNKWAAAAYHWKSQSCTAKDYAGAKQWFDQVIANGKTPSGEKYDLLENYPDIFNAEFDNHKEAIYRCRVCKQFREYSKRKLF